MVRLRSLTTLWPVSGFEATCVIFSVASHSDGRTGQFSFGSEVLPVTLLDLPCVVESYKTYDDNHLVKMCDVGQVRCYVCCPVPAHAVCCIACLSLA